MLGRRIVRKGDAQNAPKTNLQQEKETQRREILKRKETHYTLRTGQAPQIQHPSDMTPFTDNSLQRKHLTKITPPRRHRTATSCRLMEFSTTRPTPTRPETQPRRNAAQHPPPAMHPQEARGGVLRSRKKAEGVCCVVSTRPISKLDGLMLAKASNPPRGFKV